MSEHPTSLKGLEVPAHELDPNAPKPEPEVEEQPTSEAPEQDASAEVVPVTPDLPDKFKGKSAHEIADSYMQLEQQLGKQSNELGTLRSQFDKFLMKEFESRTPPKEESKPDFAYEPERAVAAVVRKETEELRKELETARQERQMNEFRAKHPDYQQLGNSAEMQSWVTETGYRQALFNRAAQGDLIAADEILTQYKEIRKVTAPQQEAAQAQNQEAMQNLASVPTQPATTVDAMKKPVYRRSDLIDLKVKEPSRYAANYEEIMAAYAEKRVI